MRLLLDEHHSRHVAEQLRLRGHDVVAAAEREQLRGVADDVLLKAAIAERRAIVSEDARDFSELHGRWLQRDLVHFGLVFTLRRRFRRRKAAPGALVAALDALLRAHPRDDALRGQALWL